MTTVLVICGVWILACTCLAYAVVRTGAASDKAHIQMQRHEKTEPLPAESASENQVGDAQKNTFKPA